MVKISDVKKAEEEEKTTLGKKVVEEVTDLSN